MRNVPHVHPIDDLPDPGGALRVLRLIRRHGCYRFAPGTADAHAAVWLHRAGWCRIIRTPEGEWLAVSFQPTGAETLLLDYLDSRGDGIVGCGGDILPFMDSRGARTPDLVYAVQFLERAGLIGVERIGGGSLKLRTLTPKLADALE